MTGIPETLRQLTVPVAGLTPYADNPRRGNVVLIVDSLRRHGQYRPLVVRARTNEVLAGNHTLRAALELGWTDIAVTFVDVDDDEAARIVLIDNRSNDVAGYDEDELYRLLDSLPDLEGTGFDVDDLAELAPAPPAALNDVDDAPDVPEPDSVISRPGDVWQLGPHRVGVGSSTDPDYVRDLLGGDRVDCIWTDPPYGVNIVGGTAAAQPSMHDSPADMPDLLAGMAATIGAVAAPGTPVYVAHADAIRPLLQASLETHGVRIRQSLIWVKNTFVLGRADYHWQHEPILYGFTEGGTGRLGRGGDRWHGDHRQATIFDVAKPSRSEEHPTMKPVELIDRMLTNSLRRGGLVLDLFGGSGSTLIAAHHHGSRAVLVELDPAYADVICRRWQEHTGVVPIRDGAEIDFLEAA